MEGSERPDVRVAGAISAQSVPIFRGSVRDVVASASLSAAAAACRRLVIHDLARGPGNDRPGTGLGA